VFEKNAPIVKLFKNPQKIWENLDLSELNQLHFTGGEPLLNDDNKKILVHLDSIGRLPEVSISYNTNGTIFPDDETLELWAKSKWVRLFFSLDGVGSVFEYTRYPANWDIVQSNIQAFRQLKSCVIIEVNAVVGIHNIFDLPKFFNWWEQNCQTGSHGDPSQIFVRQIENITYGGRVLDLKYLPDNMKPLALDLLQSLTQYRGVKDLINYISANDGIDNYEWIDYFNKLDSLRGTNWQKDLPYQLSMHQKNRQHT
jgi:MoaA/NifB/PqqE/SkfB family radical SAM enzyme